jgi:hypothetical protein
MTAGTGRQMLLAAQNMLYGSAEAAWRWRGANPRLYLDLDGMSETARWAERGKFQFVFIADHSPEQIAGQLQELFEAGACDGFVIVPDVVGDGLPAFVEQVIPILQRRDLFDDHCEVTTLREHLDVPHQYGRRPLDHRVTKARA